MKVEEPGRYLREAPEDILPICIYCKEDLDYLWVKSDRLPAGREILVCPNCRSILGLTSGSEPVAAGGAGALS